ncbi:MAG: GNAT family N-acetyltransferase [Hyphomicrobiaceae bacterium]|nr:MAG: GNAT family N-acetyltransferase [Hyphomicrobiaceae bacterium]
MTAAQERPADFIHVGTMWGDALCGFAIARILRGEFGREHAVAVLDALGVEPETQECGIGHALMEELIKAMREMGIRSLQSQVDWANQDLLRFLQASDFKIAPRLALERSVVERLDETIEDV